MSDAAARTPPNAVADQAGCARRLEPPQRPARAGIEAGRGASRVQEDEGAAHERGRGERRRAGDGARPLEATAPWRNGRERTRPREQHVPACERRELAAFRSPQRRAGARVEAERRGRARADHDRPGAEEPFAGGRPGVDPERRLERQPPEPAWPEWTLDEARRTGDSGGRGHGGGAVAEAELLDLREPVRCGALELDEVGVLRLARVPRARDAPELGLPFGEGPRELERPAGDRRRAVRRDRARDEIDLEPERRPARGASEREPKPRRAFPDRAEQRVDSRSEIADDEERDASDRRELMAFSGEDDDPPRAEQRPEIWPAPLVRAEEPVVVGELERAF